MDPEFLEIVRFLNLLIAEIVHKSFIDLSCHIKTIPVSELVFSPGVACKAWGSRFGDCECVRE